jgi:hypothetical protein
MQKKGLLLILGLYILSSVVSYSAFSSLTKSGGSGLSVSDQTADELEEGETLLAALLEIDPGEPKDQPCPLNGQLYTQTERSAWEQHRPLAVMIENSPDARPQSGMGRADVVFEAIAEGGVTRFMGMFYCDVQRYDTILAPVRSARSYFIDWASGFNYPLYTHVGGANIPGPADALGQINQYGWALENDLNQFSIGYPTFVRNGNRLAGKQVATEHTMETSTERLWKVAESREWTNMSPERRLGKKVIPGADWKDGYTPWEFVDGAAAGTSVTPITFAFWDGYDQYGVKWDYDATTNRYKRTMAGEPHVDLNDDKQIEVSNAVVLFTTEKGPIDEAKHMLYATTGTGKALVFQNGQTIDARWSKKDREDELTFTDAKGKDLSFVRGPIWISVVDIGTTVSY